MEDNKTPEQLKKLPPELEDKPSKGLRLFFHGTTLDSAQLIKEHGLFASAVTLTPSLEMVLKEYTANEDSILTFWRPEKGEVFGNLKFAMPNKRISPEERSAISEALDKQDMGLDRRRKLLEILDEATSILPLSRLEAIIKMSKLVRFRLLGLRGSFYSIAMRYSNEKNKLLKEVKSALENAEVLFLKPGKTIGDLASDIVKSAVEHELLMTGYQLKKDNSMSTNALENELTKNALLIEWKSKYKGLDSLKFAEPLYERYRIMLLRKINKFLKSLGDPSES